MKQSSEELIEEISDFLIIYLKSGKVELNSFIKKTHLQISKLEQLLQIHFLLKDEVKQFVRDLPTLIRRFKTSTKIKQDTYHGKIKGQINWPKTINERLAKNSRDKTIFAVNERNREYAIKENQVLLEVIQILYSILFKKIDSEFYKRYTWFQEWNTLMPMVSEIFTKNVYLSRVRMEQTKVTDRMIIDTLKHRNPLYRNAAFILQQYRKVLSGDMNQQDIQQLLRETFVYPEEEDVLFELYWVIKLIEQNANNVHLQVIDGRNNLVAYWDDDEYLYKVYHDSTGSKQIKFNIKTDEISLYKHPFISRKLSSLTKAESLASNFFGKSFDSFTYWSGRPDVLVEKYEKETNKLNEIIIGEVKHTSSVDYAITGLRELVDYVTLIKDNNNKYLDQNEGIEVKGILFTDRINIKKSNEIYLDLRRNNDEIVHVSV
ncbi:hypothetical protein GLW05_19910 [Pontibacillus yanchengensis]|uniref:DUF2357 domain-containing protein n=1 Tax=Pontibacillus yanchengensis TaxID=462910 RepID=A0A6I5A631_9BACI|nr:hypothetical protein [Pontibacillus yanchengensis]MYL35841.1 hypothetical protein [Pontibacillus yanchengensis]